jgi:competence protein ComEA
MANRDDRPSSDAIETGALLRRLDQAAIAVIVGVSLCLIAAWALRCGGSRQGSIDIQDPPARPVRFQVDINTADWPELSLLPGVGQVLARRIVESRQQSGPFIDHDDLRRVSGIGPKTVEAIKPYLLPIPGAGDIAER